FVERLPGGDALYEFGRLVEDRSIGAVEDDFDRLLLEAGFGQHVLEARAFPARIAHRAGSPLDARHVRAEQAGAVSRALIDSDDLVGRVIALELVEGELERRVRRIAPDSKAPRRGADLWNVGEVIANEEGLVRRQQLVEIADRGLVVRRPLGELD